MSDHNDPQSRKPQRTTDVVTLLAGIATLLVSTYLLTDADVWLSHVDLRWVLAGAAVAVGLLMLVVSMRPRKDGS
ncbi:hypothetical protein [Saccharomonospora sp.]|uniref:hypothetical protein n=1 Tax=Saccharomonospora sp. TaxID=33913 RepID=UPI002624299D|nr:hypothetical protein [Saccharomonospora sp.]